jgi:hypothetical protein
LTSDLNRIFFISLGIEIELIGAALTAEPFFRIFVGMPSKLTNVPRRVRSFIGRGREGQRIQKSFPHMQMVLFVLAVSLLRANNALAQQPSPSGQDWSQSGQEVQNPDAPNQDDPGYGQQAHADSSPATQQPLNAAQLEQLVAPIALYPDALVAQVLAASTYPAQVEQADRWRQERANASPAEIASGADIQPWDASVKALTAFPQVLAQMDRNLQWTTDLGNAYYNQPGDVLQAVQVMRGRAQAAGNLRSTPQEVVRDDGDNIVVAPANPQVVYVPAYNPWAVYGAAISPYPGFSLLGAVGDFFTSTIGYGLGIAMNAFMHTPWGWLAWGLDWLAHSLTFHGSGYYSHSGTVAHWGFPHNRFYAYSGRAGVGRGNEFRRNDGWRRGRVNSGGWHEFGRGSESLAGNWGRKPDGFASFRSDRSAEFRRSETPRSGGFARTEAFNRGGQRFAGSQADRAPAGGFAHQEYGRSPNLARTSGKSHGGLFGGGHSQKGFRAGRSNFRGGGFHGGGRAPKFHGGSGGHSHGGGHSGGHGGGHGGRRHH